MSDQDADVFDDDQTENSTIRDLRKQIKDKDAEIKALKPFQARAEELETKVEAHEADRAAADARAALSQVGLQPTQGFIDRFVAERKGNADLQPLTFAKDLGLAVPEQAEGESAPAEKFFSPAPTGAPPSVTKPPLTKAELDHLLRTDPAAGYKAMDEARVEWH